MFAVNQKVVYPGHGVAVIDQIIEKKIGQNALSFFELSFVRKDMKILVPVHNIKVVGLRTLVSLEQIEELFNILMQPNKKKSCDASMSNWNKRHKEYQGIIRAGNITDMCLIYRNLKWLEHEKDLSFGEKNLLSQIEDLLAGEIAVASSIQEEAVVHQLRLACSDGMHTATGARTASTQKEC